MGAIQSCLAPAPYTELCAKHLEDTILNYYMDLASTKMDGSIIGASDQYFGDAENLIDDSEPSEEGADRDGERDGWQTKRHVDSAWTIVRLGCQGHLYGFDVNTLNFRDAAPLTVTIEASRSHAHGAHKWTTLLPDVQVKPNGHNFFLLGGSSDVYSQVKMTISPGGGVARLRCYGTAVPSWTRSLKHPVNLASVHNGARITRWTDTTYANDPRILMDHGESTADGWETLHSRESERNDYVVIQFGVPGTLSSVAVSTKHFLGNAPDTVSLAGCYSLEEDPAYDYAAEWVDIVQHGLVKPNAVTTFKVSPEQKFSHLRLTVHPDGGIQQILALGTPQIEEKKNNNNKLVLYDKSRRDASSDESTVVSTETTSVRRKRQRASADKAVVAIQETIKTTTRAKRRHVA